MQVHDRNPAFTAVCSQAARAFSFGHAIATWGCGGYGPPVRDADGGAWPLKQAVHPARPAGAAGIDRSEIAVVSSALRLLHVLQLPGWFGSRWRTVCLLVLMFSTMAVLACVLELLPRPYASWQWLQCALAKTEQSECWVGCW